jgi:hypothetical protein
MGKLTINTIDEDFLSLNKKGPLLEEVKKYKSARDMYNNLPPMERGLFDEA